MNPIFRFIALLSLTLAAGPAAHPADPSPPGMVQQTGSITGRVQNVVTGQYLNKARVAVKGTEQVTFTDEFGVYQLNQVRSGPVVLEVFYTDLDVQEIPIDVRAGGLIERDVELTSEARYGK